MAGGNNLERRGDKVAGGRGWSSCPPGVEIECLAILGVVLECDSTADHDLGSLGVASQQLQDLPGVRGELLRCDRRNLGTHRLVTLPGGSHYHT